MAMLAEKWVYRPSVTRHVVGVSKGVAQEMREHFPSMAREVTVIFNAVDQDVFRADPIARRGLRQEFGLVDSDLVVLFVGGDWLLKGLPLAIQAVKDLAGCHLVVVGSGNVDLLPGVARRLRDEHRLHFVGRRTDTPRYFAAADVFVLPSAYEAFSMVSLEAAASGLPLLVTRVNGAEEILADGENGWFIERDPEAIASRLRTLQADTGLRRQMAARSRELVAPYTWQRVVDDYVDLYERLRPARSAAVPLKV